MAVAISKSLFTIPSAEWLRTHGDAAKYTASSVFRTVVMFVASLVTVRVIAPHELGMWNSMSLLTSYVLLIQAGIINGLSRELPFQLGADKPEIARRLVGTSQTFILGVSILIMVGGVSALFLYHSRNAAVLFSIAAVTIVTVTTYYQNYLTVTFRSKSSFGSLARVQLWTAGLMLISVPLIVYWRYDGMLFRIILVSLVGSLLFHAARPIKVGLLWDRSAFKTLMMTGLPIFALAYVESISMTADRVVLLKVGGVEQVGYYSLALYTWQGFTVIPLSLAAYIYPRMSYSYGKNSDPRVLWTMAWKTTLGVFAIMTPICIVGWMAVPVAVTLLFPNYVAGIPATQGLLCAAVFYGASIGVNALWSMKAWRYMVAYQVVGSSFRIIGPVAGVFMASSPTIGVAYGTLVAYAGSSVVGLLLTYVATHRSYLVHRSESTRDDSPPVGSMRINEPDLEGNYYQQED